jgi:opacity protein-like surface antigen
MGVRILLVLLVAVLSLGGGRSHAASFASGLGFEVGGFMTSVSPEEYNEMFTRFGLDGIDRVYGVTVGVSEQLNRPWRLAIRTGYSRGSTNTGQVMVTDASGMLVGETGYEYTVESIPLLVGADFRIANDAAALVLRVDGGVGFTWVTHRIHEVGSIPGHESSSSETLARIGGAVGAEFRLADRLLLGLQGGYSVSKGKIPFPDSPDVNPDLDISGVVVGAYFIVQPWRANSRPD